MLLTNEIQQLKNIELFTLLSNDCKYGKNTYFIVFFNSGRGNKITFNGGDDNGTIGLWVRFERV